MAAENRTFYYARISSRDQNPERQIQQFKELGAEDRDIIVDRVSGKNLDRTGYLGLRNHLLRNGDTLVITELDRLSRNKEEIKEELVYYREKNIRVKILNMPTTLIDLPEEQSWVFEMVNNILIEVLGSIAEQERNTILNRQRQGIEIAKKNNVKFGRPLVELPENWDEVIGRWKLSQITAVQAMDELGMKKATFYKYVNKMNIKKNKTKDT